MSTTILVTGATGTIGSQVVAALAGRDGVAVRAAVRGGKEAKTKAKNVSTVDFEYDRRETLAPALDGVERLFLVTPFSDKQVELASHLIDAAKSAGVKRIVKLSAIGCDIEPGIQLGRWHRAVEKHVEASGIPYTFLRPNNFFENFINFYGPDKEGTIYLPWGDARCSFIAGADIAEVAALALTSSGHEGKAYELTGPAAISIAEAAAAIAEAAGRGVRYVDVPEAAARKALLDFGAPAWMTDAMMELHAIDKAGYAAATNDTFEKLTGRPATPFAVFAQKHAAAWKA
ncbi:MAG: SDR family oxidoreductase [Polyangiaceae bacterium]